MDYARAVAALYQAPHGEFVAERKRLAAELKTAGDKDGAKTLAKLGRPPISAWAVNQLFWHAREAFDRLMATAAQLRDGNLSVSAAHRDAIAKLRQRAATILTEAGHNASEGTLRRTALTLSAIAAIGSFAPDPPGALSDDRDPPGFEAAALVVTDRPPPMLSVAPPPPPVAVVEEEAEEEEDDDDDDPQVSSEEREAAAELLRALAPPKPTRHLASVPPANVRKPDEAEPPKRARHLSAVPFPSDSSVSAEPADDDERAEREAIAAVRAAAADRAEKEERERIAAVRIAAAEKAEKAERERLAEEKRRRERDRLETLLRTARGEIEIRKRAADALRADLARAEKSIVEASDVVASLEAALAKLDQITIT